MHVEGVEWKAHYVVIAAFDAGDADAADPFLDAVGPGFVQRVEIMDVEVNFPVGKGVEGDVGCFGEGVFVDF